MDIMVNDMDRLKFLNICQKVSLLKNGICGTKENVPDELKVVFNGIVYYPIAYELSFDKGNTVHKAILHDLKSNSIMHVKLERVVKYGESGIDKVN